MDLLKQISRFFGVGLAATAVHLSVAVVCYWQFGFTALQANVAAFIMAWSVSYAGNFHCVFPASSHRNSFPRFAAVSIVGLIVNNVLVWFCIDWLHMDYMLALVPVVAITPLLVFLLCRNWAFRASVRPQQQVG